MAESLTAQVQLTADLQKNIEAIKKTATGVTEAYTEQFKVIKQIVEALNSVKVDDAAEKLEKVNEQAQKVAKNLEKSGGAGQQVKKLTINVTDLEKKLGKTARGAAYMTAAVSGLTQGFRNFMALTKQGVKVLGTLASSITKVGLSIMSIPFKMFKALIHEAQQGMGDFTDLLQQIEEVRKQFGQFAQSSAKAVFDVTKTMGGFSETGLSTWRVFGTLAERMQFIRELATGMGVAWSHMVTHVDMKKEGGHILAYMKGLGLAAEEMKGLYNRSVATGEQITDLGVQMTKYSYAMAKAFGLSAKEISRDVGKAIKDVAHFGQLTIKEINIAATYARKLNIEFEKITGTLDAFETFDTAADNASMMAQAFGANVDAFKMMEAQNPADQLEMLRRAMFAAGKDADRMSRQELKLLAQTSGLDAETAKLAFSFKNQGVSLDEIRKKANQAENAQMTQAKAMQTIAGAIERMVKSGTLREFTGFLDAFIDGMLTGIRSSKEFIKMFRNIWMSLRVTWWEGWKLGRELINIVPGMRDVVEVLTRMFDPEKYKDSAHKVAMIIRDFFTEVTTGKFSFKKLMDRIHQHFYNFLDAQTPEGQRLLNNAKGMFKHLGNIAGQAIEYFSEKIVTGLKELASYIRDPKAWLDKAKKGAGGGMKFAMEVLDPIISALRNAWPPLSAAVRELFTAAWDKAKAYWHSPEFRKVLIDVFPTMLAIVAGPAATRTLSVGIVDMFSRGAMFAVEKFSTGPALKGVGEFFASKLGMALSGAAAVALAVTAGIGISEGMRKFRGKIMGEFTDAEKDVAAGMTGLVDMLTLGLVPDVILDAVVTLVARGVTAVKDSVNQILGGLGDTMLGMLHGQMKLLGGIGDMILGLFKGDSDRVVNGIKSFFMGVIETSWNFFRMQFVQLPLLLIKWFYKAMFTFWGAVPKLIGGLLDSMGLHKLGKMFRVIGDIITKVGTTVGNAIDWIGSSISKVIGFVIDLFDETSAASNTWYGKIIRFVANVVKWFNPLYLAARGLYEGFLLLGKAIEWFYDKLQNWGVFRFIERQWMGFQKIAGDAIDALTDKLEFVSLVMDEINKGNIVGAIDSATVKIQARAAQAAEAAAGSMGKGVVNAANKAVTEQVKQEGSFWDKLFEGGDIDVSADPSSALGFAEDATKRVDELTASVQKINTDQLKKSMEKLQKVFAKDGPVLPAISQINEVLNKDQMAVMQDTLHTLKTVGEALNAAMAMVKSSAELERVLTNLNLGKINVKAKLQNVANAVGLGGKANYEIKNRGVTIQVEFNVQMSAAQVERTLIMNAKSIIRDRLNSAEYSVPPKPGVPAIPDQPNYTADSSVWAPSAPFVGPPGAQ